jgi:hypothetical protein
MKKDWLVFQMVDINGKKLIGMQQGVEWLDIGDEILVENITKEEAKKQMKHFSEQRKVEMVNY